MSGQRPDGTALPAVSVAAPANPATPTRPYSDRLSEADATLAKFDFVGEIDTVDDVATSLAMIDLFADIAKELPTSDEDKASRLAFTQRLRTTQRQVLPALRDKYGPALRQELWEADGSAKTIGQGFRTVEFVSAVFAANRNIKSTFETMYPSLMKLRFTRAQFRWYQGADEVTYYSLEPPSDEDIVSWSGASFIRVLPLP